MTGIDWLRVNLQKVLALPAPAIEWLLMLYGAIQVFDDVADGDAVERDDLNAAIWNTLVGMSQNTFWIANSQTLTPIVASMILKWQASDQAERSGKADSRSFVWRAGYNNSPSHWGHASCRRHHAKQCSQQSLWCTNASR